MKIPNRPVQPLSFLTFWVFITEKLGDSHGSINPNTKTAQQLFSNFDDQQGILKDIITRSYADNKCRHIKDHIDINLVLDILGAKAFELKMKQSDDLLDIELLEEICWLICQHHAHFVKMPELRTVTANTSLATVRSLSTIKIRLANNKP